MALVLPATYTTNEIEVEPSNTPMGGKKAFSLKVGKPGDRLFITFTLEEFRAVIAKGADLLAAHDAEAAPAKAVA